MITIDLRKQFKHLYQPSAKKFSIVDVPPLNFLMIDGAGNPNTSQDYQDALEALYGLSYTLEVRREAGQVRQEEVRLSGDGAGRPVVDGRHARVQPRRAKTSGSGR